MRATHNIAASIEIVLEEFVKSTRVFAGRENSGSLNSCAGSDCGDTTGAGETMFSIGACVPMSNVLSPGVKLGLNDGLSKS